MSFTSGTSDHFISRMSKLNGQYGIVDESDSNRTIISLKLTPAAAEKIKKFIEYKGINSKGYINFSTDKDDLITEVKILKLGHVGTILRVVQTQAILFLKSMAEKVGSDIQRL